MSSLELHLLGTGTSGCIPAISCITKPSEGCDCCLSALTPEGKKNVRRNTSAVLRVKKKGRESDESATKTILIDCGKSFLTSALEWFPKKGFRKIDAVILTHPHSDAMSGLDDLRGWTLGGAIQDTMDIYVNQSTFTEVERTYPYLVSSKLATGGGDVPAMNWIVFDDAKTFDVCGVTVTPLPVHHGWYFTKQEPYFCLGFLFNRSLAYISDVSFIPESTWKLLEGTHVKESEPASEQDSVSSPTQHAKEVIDDAHQSLENNLDPKASTNGTLNGTQSDEPVKALIIDCLRIYPHTSHFGFAQAIETSRRLGAQRNYMMGFAHRATHKAWEEVCYAVERGQRPKNPPKRGGSRDKAYGAYNPAMRHSEVVDEFREICLEVMEEWQGGPETPVWIRPGFDGQTIFVDEVTGKAWDDEYSSSQA